jgi:hypothetical protein
MKNNNCKNRQRPRQWGLTIRKEQKNRVMKSNNSRRKGLGWWGAITLK